MPDLNDFINCVKAGLKDRRYGAQRIKNIVDDYTNRVDRYKRQGRTDADAAMQAMSDMQQERAYVAAEGAKRTAAMLAVQASNRARLEQALTVDLKVFDAGRSADGKKTSRGKALGMAAVSLIENNPQFKGLDVTTDYHTTFGQLHALWDDALGKIGKGAWGRQMGTVHLPNIIKEAFGEKSGDNFAEMLSRSWYKIDDLAVDLFNQAGGSLRKFKNYLPQPKGSIAKLMKGEEAWFKSRADRWDWDRMTWPDGKPIDVADRPGVMRHIFDTWVTDGANKIDADAFRGQGRALGNMLDTHRFIHYKNADAWMADLAEFGDGNVIDTLFAHIDNMAHKISLVKNFGPNPEATATNIENMVRKMASEHGPMALRDAESVLQNKFRPMLDLTLRKNPMNPESFLGNMVVGTSNLLTSAQLGSAAIPAMFGDFATTFATRAANGLDLFGGMGYYFKTLLTDRAGMRDIMNQTGFVAEEVVKMNYAAQRLTGVAMYGRKTRAIADAVMRASMMSSHTTAARWSVQAELMGVMARMSKDSFDDLPFKDMMARYNITAADWDAFRSLKAWSPQQGTNFLRPRDILEAKLPNGQELFRKFQGMIHSESRMAVMDSSMEASVMLKGTARPDTWSGAIMHSFAMYKNFPVSFWLTYGRIGMTSKSAKGRIGFYAGLGAAMTMVGALTVQAREVSKGNDPMPMDTPAFWGKSLLTGGALSLWGDFLFGSVNRFGGSPGETAAGPVFGLMGDTTQLAFGNAFAWADSVGNLGDANGTPVPEAAKMVEFLRRYTPGTNVWWLRAALERNVWDRLAELSDPKVYDRRRRQADNQRKAYGNETFWPRGEALPDRPPSFSGGK